MPANLKLATAFIELSLKNDRAVVDRLKGMSGRIASSMNELSNASAPAQQGILSLVAAASPQAFNTFQGSIRLLAASLGSSFIPMVMDASAWLQRLATYIREMDPELKKQIASWAGYAVAILGVVAVTRKLFDVFTLLAKNPIGLAIGAGIAAVASVVALLNSKLEETAKRVAEVVAQAKRMKEGIYTEGEYKRSAAAAIEEDDDLTGEEKLAKAKEIRGRITDENRALKRKADNMGEGEKIGNSLKGLAGGVNPAREMETTNAMQLKEGAMLDELIKRLEGNKGGPKFTNKEDLDKDKKKEGMLMAGNGQGGQVSSLENAFMQTASKGLEPDDLQQKMMQIQQENLAVAQKAAAANERTAQAMERQTMR